MHFIFPYCTVSPLPVSEQDLGWIYNVLRSHSHLWKEVAKELKFSEGKISAIARSQKKTEGCLRDMLSRWLLQGDDDARNTNLHSLMGAMEHAKITSR